MRSGIALALASAVSLGGLGAASAADMAVKARPMPPVVVDPGTNWSGFYIGGNIGGGWSNTTFNGIPVTGDHFLLATSSFSTGNSDSGNWVGGVQGGYNWQFNRIVLGIEGTYSGSGVKNSTGLIADPRFAGENIQLNSKITQYATIVGRLGFAPTNDWLLYGKGGWATARIETNPLDFFPLPATLQHFSSAAAWHNGWTAGVGVEYKWRRNWVVGLEYDYYRFNSQTHSNATIGTTGNGVGLPTFYSQNVNANLSTITARLSYLFNPGPVVAKY